MQKKTYLNHVFIEVHLVNQIVKLYECVSLMSLDLDFTVRQSSLWPIGPPQVKCRLLISSIFDAMNF